MMDMGMGGNPMQLLNSLGAANGPGGPGAPAGQAVANGRDDAVLQAFGHPTPQGAPQGAAEGGVAPLLDGLDLSAPGDASLLYAKAQFEVSARSIQAMVDDAGNASYRERSFSMSGTFEFLSVASGQDAGALQELDGQALMDKMKEFFSPEKTAGRILDFALAQYAPEGEDNAEARQGFADRIGKAIQKGFDQAQAILGEIEESIQKGIDQTHERVFTGLDDFVENGLPEDHAERTEAIREYAEQFQRSVHIQYSRTDFSRQVVYGRNGAIRDAPGGAETASSALEAQA